MWKKRAKRIYKAERRNKAKCQRIKGVVLTRQFYMDAKGNSYQFTNGMPIINL
jgi:hypothetical protein